MDKILEVVMANLPSIVTGICGLITGVIVFLCKRLKYRSILAEKDIENAELQKAIVTGSYVICPACGNKIKLVDTRVYTGGITNEIETKSK